MAGIVVVVVLVGGGAMAGEVLIPVALVTLVTLVRPGLGGCMFQEPFYFTSAPKINAILDRRGRPLADK